MPNKKLDVTDLSLDPLGRIVLSDDLLDEIKESDGILDAGANSLNCHGSTNLDCTNTGACTSTTNHLCTNANFCLGSSNISSCGYEQAEIPE